MEREEKGRGFLRAVEEGRDCLRLGERPGESELLTLSLAYI